MTQRGNSIIDIQDVKNIWRIFTKNWYIIGSLILVSYILSQIYTYKISKTYAAKTQILLKSEDIYDYQTQLYKSIGYYESYQDVANQKRVVTSTNLIQKAISKLSLDVSYYIVGRFKTEEVFEYIPFKVDVRGFNSDFYEKEINFRIKDDKSFEISYSSPKGDINYNETYQFGELILSNNLNFVINKTDINQQAISSLKEIEYKFIIHNPTNIVYKYKNAVNVDNIEWTNILEVTVEDNIPQRAVQFLDTLSSVYIDYTLKSQIDVNENTLNYIDKQLNEVTEILTSIEDDLENYKKEKTILDLNKEENEYFQKLVAYDADKRKIDIELQSINSLEQYILKNQDEKLLPPSVYIISGDDYLKTTINELYSLQMTRNAELFNVKEKSITINQIDEKINLLRKNLLTYIFNTKKALSVEEANISAQINNYEALIQTIPNKERQMLSIERKQQVNEKMYVFLLEKRANTVIARAGIIPETKIIETAHSIGIVKPNKEKISYSFIGVGLVISLLIAFIRTIFFEKIESLVELKNQTNLPVLGEILFSEEAKQSYIVVTINSRAAITESFRSVRTNLEYLLTDEQSKVVLITSTNPGEGKTFCSINLAAILAKAGKKVLVMELDLHRPKVQTGLNMTSDYGISSFLIGKQSLSNIILKTTVENMDVVFSGPIPPNASELIMSPRLSEMICHYRGIYDYIIIDTPPVGLISDALVLMKHSDINLFVLNTKYANKNAISNAQEIVNTHKVKNFGFILNGVERKKSKYYYNKYGYGYGYGYGYSQEYPLDEQKPV